MKYIRPRSAGQHFVIEASLEVRAPSLVDEHKTSADKQRFGLSIRSTKTSGQTRRQGSDSSDRIAVGHEYMIRLRLVNCATETAINGVRPADAARPNSTPVFVEREPIENCNLKMSLNAAKLNRKFGRVDRLSARGDRYFARQIRQFLGKQRNVTEVMTEKLRFIDQYAHVCPLPQLSKPYAIEAAENSRLVGAREARFCRKMKRLI